MKLDITFNAADHAVYTALRKKDVAALTAENERIAAQNAANPGGSQTPLKPIETNEQYLERILLGAIESHREQAKKLRVDEANADEDIRAVKDAINDGDLVKAQEKLDKLKARKDKDKGGKK